MLLLDVVVLAATPIPIIVSVGVEVVVMVVSLIATRMVVADTTRIDRKGLVMIVR